MADLVFLLVQGPLFLLADMTAVLPRHVAFLLADGTVFAVQPGGLGLAHLPFLHFLVDARILLLQAVVHLLAARVVLVEVAVGGQDGAGGQEGSGDEQGCDDLANFDSPLGLEAGRTRPVSPLFAAKIKES
jgi:hypothetical protein